jgi:hypothetical protein
MIAAVSASGRALSGNLLPTKPESATRWVNVVNGVAKASATSLQSSMAVSQTAGGTGAATSPLTASMGFVGYNAQGACSTADINPAKSEMPSISVKAHLIKGFTYSVASTFSYLGYAKAPTASMSVMGPSDSKAMPLNLKGGSFIAKETGDYTFTWSLSNGGRFVGAFSATVNGTAPPLPKTTGSANIDALLQRGAAWWHDKGTAPVLGTSMVMPNVMALSTASARHELTYSFISANAVPTEILKKDFPKAGQDKSFAEMNANQKAAVKAALSYISTVTNLHFTEAQDGSGNIQLGDYNMDSQKGGVNGLDGISNLPDSYPLTDKVYTFLNSNPISDQGDWTAGTKGWSDIWHEIGHALGLKHPGNYDAAGSGATGPFLPAAMDNRQYSVMSYKSNASSLGVNNQSYMLYDVAALQFLYGVNGSGSTAQGDTGGAGGCFNFSNMAPALSTLYSATGKDTIDLSGCVKGSAVNLNAGTYSSINNLNDKNTGNPNVAVAYGSSINKVTLSTAVANDTVTLNAAFKQGAFNLINNLQTGDRIELSKALFGSLSAKNIELNTSGVAMTKDSRIVVNKSTGEVYYDADGVGTKSNAVKIAAYQGVQGASISVSTFGFLA